MQNKFTKTLKQTLMFIAIIIAMFASSCKTAPVSAPVPETVKLPMEQQQELALQSYKDMLDKTARMTRVEKRDIMAKGFEDVMRNYPDTSYAHESYFHLIRHYLYNYDTPREKEAEGVYGRYFETYEDPRLGNTLSLEMAKYYLQFERLDRLVSLTVPFMQEYVETGKMRDGLFLYYYSEAKFILKDYKESLRGYVTYARLYPGNNMEKFVQKRLKEIKHMLKKEKQAEKDKQGRKE